MWNPDGTNKYWQLYETRYITIAKSYMDALHPRCHVAECVSITPNIAGSLLHSELHRPISIPNRNGQNLQNLLQALLRRTINNNRALIVVTSSITLHCTVSPSLSVSAIVVPSTPAPVFSALYQWPFVSLLLSSLLMVIMGDKDTKGRRSDTLWYQDQRPYYWTING
jgi:hypothetical protein